MEVLVRPVNGGSKSLLYEMGKAALGWPLRLFSVLLSSVLSSDGMLIPGHIRDGRQKGAFPI